MNIEREKFLTEVMGERWNFDYYLSAMAGVRNNNFSTWPGFGKLACFLEKDESIDVLAIVKSSLPFDDGFPDRFADKAAMWLKESQSC